MLEFFHVYPYPYVQLHTIWLVIICINLLWLQNKYIAMYKLSSMNISYLLLY